MKIGSISEDQNVEKRIAITPEIVKKYISLGLEVILIEKQMSFGKKKTNTMALKLGQNCYTYFLMKYNGTKTVLEYPAYYKTQVLGAPKKGIGDSTIKKIYNYAEKNKLCLEDSIFKLLELNEFKPKIHSVLNSLTKLIKKWRVESKNIKHFDLLKVVLDESGYSSTLKNKKDLENENRLENLKELLRAMQDYDSLESFLDHVALATSIDQEWEGEKINLMTMHAAKGLEFDVVFLPGWEEGLFPHQKSLQEKGDFALEEERRLAYVGITRAKKEAYLSFAMRRAYQGDYTDTLPSRFINELPDVSVEKNEPKENSDRDDFEFNQDLNIDFNEEYRSPGWERLKKSKLLKWKK